MFVSKRSFFEVMQTILRKQTFPIAVHKNALALIAAVLYQNSTAQTLFFEVGLLQDLLTAYEHYAQALFISSSCVTSSTDGFTFDLWINTNSALCFAVNNPQNETNQDKCKTIFPLLLRILEFSSNTQIKSSISSFLSLSISNNEKCQDHFSACDGFLVLKRCFQKYYEALQLDIKICNNVIGKGTFQAINNLIGIISSASLNHKENAAITGKLGIITMMINLLFVETLDRQLRTKIILSLGHCIDICCANKSYVLETENFDAFLKNSLQLKDAELTSACKYLLQVCLINAGSSEADQGNQLTETENVTNCTGITSEKKIWNSESHFHYLDVRSLKNKEVTENLSLKRNSVKSPTGRSSNFKFSNKLTRNSERKSAQISTSSESSPDLLRKKRKLSVFSQRQLNGSTYAESEHLSHVNMFKKDQPSKKLLLTKPMTDSSHSVHSCTLTNRAPHSSCGFDKQKLIPTKLTFRDFLTNDDEKSTRQCLNNSQSFNLSGCSQTASDMLPSKWNRYKKSKIWKDKGSKQTQPFYSSDKMSNSTQNQKISDQPAFKKQLGKRDSMKENCPKLFKKKKSTLFSMKSQNMSSSSGSEYTFTPPNEESSNDSGFEFSIPNQSALNLFAENSFSSDRANIDVQNRDVHWNLDVSKCPKRKLVCSSTSSAHKSNSHSEFHLNLPTTKYEDNVSKNNKYPCRKDYLMKDSNRQISEERTSTALPKNDISCNQTQELFSRDFSFNEQVSQFCESSENLNDLDEFGSSTQTFVPKAFSASKENLKNRKRSWSGSSTADSCQSNLNSSLNSSKLMQVIVLPLKTCDEHGLSAAVEMLEVVSLEELRNN